MDAASFKKFAASELAPDSAMHTSALKIPVIQIIGRLGRKPVMHSEKFAKYQLCISIDEETAALLTLLDDKILIACTDMQESERGDWRVKPTIRDEDDPTIFTSLKLVGKGNNQKFSLRSNLKLTPINQMDLLYPDMPVQCAVSISAWYRFEDMACGVYFALDGIQFEV